MRQVKTAIVSNPAQTDPAIDPAAALTAVLDWEFAAWGDPLAVLVIVVPEHDHAPTGAARFHPAQVCAVISAPRVDPRVSVFATVAVVTSTLVPEIAPFNPASVIVGDPPPFVAPG